METLSNSILTVQIAEHGAELQSIKKDGKEYLWQGDAKFWGRRSPVLFPIVGRVWNNKYRHAGNTYEIGQHGFARGWKALLIHWASFLFPSACWWDIYWRKIKSP